MLHRCQDHEEGVGHLQSPPLPHVIPTVQLWAVSESRQQICIKRLNHESWLLHYVIQPSTWGKPKSLAMSPHTTCPHIFIEQATWFKKDALRKEIVYSWLQGNKKAIAAYKQRHWIKERIVKKQFMCREASAGSFNKTDTAFGLHQDYQTWRFTQLWDLHSRLSRRRLSFHQISCLLGIERGLLHHAGGKCTAKPLAFKCCWASMLPFYQDQAIW